MKAMSYLVLAASAFFLTSCLNLFSPFDHPTSDPQLLSAARACLDKGDYSCALTDYQKLSNNEADVANSEEAYTLYNNAGVDMGAFVGAFGNSGASAGTGITQIANVIPANVADPSSGSSISTLLEIFHGYQKVAVIQDQTLRGIVRLVGAVGIISSILADLSTTRGNLLMTDIAANPEACKTTDLTGCSNATTSNPCHQGNNNVTSGTPIAWGSATSTNDPLAQASDSDITASFGILFTAIEAAQLGLNDLSVNSGNALSLFNALSANGAASFIIDEGGSNSSPCFRQLLLNEGIGN